MDVVVGDGLHASRAIHSLFVEANGVQFAELKGGFTEPGPAGEEGGRAVFLPELIAIVDGAAVEVQIKFFRL